MTPTQHPTPALKFQSWGTLAEQLDALVSNSEELGHAANDAGFDDTMPAVCWAVPGAYAALLDY